MMRTLVLALLSACAACLVPGLADATGTARIQQSDGEVKTYANVFIRIENKSMSITSHDRKGTLILQKAACSSVGSLMRCYPYSATLKQNGTARSIQMSNGTVWLNPSETKQQLPMSSTQLPPRGVLVSLKTKKGTYVSITGTIDVLKR